MKFFIIRSIETISQGMLTIIMRTTMTNSVPL